AFGWSGSPAVSFWNANSASPTYALPPTIAPEQGLKGIYFVDVDGEGLRDLHLAGFATDTLARMSWRNNGHGWNGANLPPLPADLNDSNGSPSGLRFTDMDGDGVVDLILDHGEVRCRSGVC